MSQYVLEIRELSKEFPGVKALDKVSLNIRPGTVHSLMGENGAGKSTLMKCLFGIYHEDEGEIIFKGEKINFTNTKQALENGVAMVQQELQLAEDRSVMDNVWMGRYPKKFGFYIDEHKMYVDTKKIFDELNISIDPYEIIGNLSVSNKQMVEIAKAVSYDAEVIVFDEPTSSLNDQEIEKLFVIINDLRDKGVGIVYISHKMDEIMRISDDVSILRDGKYISTDRVENITIDEIIRRMVGRSLDKMFPPKTNVPGEVLLEVNNLTTVNTNLVQDVSFKARRGEILGLAGLVGAGRSEVLESIFGMRELSSGQIILNGQEVVNKSPKQAIKNNFALITEERRANGIFGQLDLIDNTASASYSSYLVGPMLNEVKMQRDTIKYINAMRVRTPGVHAKIKNLSGGNQQKVIIGRWLNTNPDVLLMDEPTRGIDVGAKYEIYQIMIDLAKEGKTIIMVSSEMPELFGISDRILVMSGGKVSGLVETKDTNQEEVMALAAKNV